MSIECYFCMRRGGEPNPTAIIQGLRRELEEVQQLRNMVLSLAAHVGALAALMPPGDVKASSLALADSTVEYLNSTKGA